MVHSMLVTDSSRLSRPLMKFISSRIFNLFPAEFRPFKIALSLTGYTIKFMKLSEEKLAPKSCESLASILKGT